MWGVGEFKTVKQQHTVYIHPSSVLARDEDPPKWLLYHELAFTTKEYMRTVAPIKPEWLVDIAPHYYQTADVDDALQKKVMMPNAKNIGKASQ
jgi:pre-mRNA-splicing factor ATP-dependent RNA helicase DHX16